MSDLARLKDRLSDAADKSGGSGVSLVPHTVAIDNAAMPQMAASRANSSLDGFALLSAGGAIAFFFALFFNHDAIIVVLCALGGLIGLTGFAHAAWRTAVARSHEAVEAKAQEQKQIRNAALMADMHEAMGDLVVTRDMSRRIIHANGVFRQMTGCAAPEGLSCEDIGIAFRPGNRLHCYDVEIATPQGQRIFSWHDVVAQDVSTSRLVISSIARDVTEERAATAHREEARLRAENADAAKGRLLATVSHEIRLPLSGILGMNHLLSQTSLTQEQRNYLDGMRQSGQALVQLVEDLLDYSTLEAGRFRLNTRAENLRQLIESVVEMLAHRAHEKGIEIASVVAPDVPDHLDFDPARLRQVLFNLIGNAVKFTSEGGVLVEATMRKGELSIAVEDTGPGMSRAEQARIFGEFEQAGPDEQRSAGTGLGLAISARILREFGGSLSVTSKKSVGSTFLLKFRPGASSTTTQRIGTLEKSRVLLLAPKGVAADATTRTIDSLGGVSIHAASLKEVKRLRDDGELKTLTDVIVDHRVAGEFQKILRTLPLDCAEPPRRILLVNPEERASQPQDEFDAWLIRPLREKSLIDVLSGHLRGIERRDALNDNYPGFGAAVPAAVAKREQPASLTGADILVAEDDPVNARIIRAVLERSGCKVRLVQDFAGLADVLSTADDLPSLVISDLNMPGGDGFQVLPRLCAAREAARPMPLVVLSGDTSPDTRERLTDAGVDLLLAKPVDPVRLVAEMERLLGRKDQL